LPGLAGGARWSDPLLRARRDGALDPVHAQRALGRERSASAAAAPSAATATAALALRIASLVFSARRGRRGGGGPRRPPLGALSLLSRRGLRAPRRIRLRVSGGGRRAALVAPRFPLARRLARRLTLLGARALAGGFRIAAGAAATLSAAGPSRRPALRALLLAHGALARAPIATPRALAAPLGVRLASAATAPLGALLAAAGARRATATAAPIVA